MHLEFKDKFALIAIDSKASVKQPFLLMKNAIKSIFGDEEKILKKKWKKQKSLVFQPRKLPMCLWLCSE